MYFQYQISQHQLKSWKMSRADFKQCDRGQIKKCKASKNAAQNTFKKNIDASLQRFNKRIRMNHADKEVDGETWREWKNKVMC